MSSEVRVRAAVDRVMRTWSLIKMVPEPSSSGTRSSVTKLLVEHPYLCAQWSINCDPSDVADLIEGIVVQEMYHFALAGNIPSGSRCVDRRCSPSAAASDRDVDGIGEQQAARHGSRAG